MKRYEDIDFIPFLEEQMKANTQSYQTDFEIDRQIFLRAASSERPEDKRLLWLSRTTGTLCVNERDAFIKDTPANLSWLYYAEQSDESFRAFSVEITSLRDGIPFGNIYELDYFAHAVQVAKECIQPDIVTRTFEDGYVTTMPFEKSIRSVYGLIAKHGAVEDTVVHAVDEQLLKSRLHDLHEKQNKFKLGYYVPPLRPLSIAAQTAYNGIKEAHPEAIVCFAQNGYFEIYGEDAKRAAPLIHSKLLMKELEGGGRITVTGFKESEWILRSNMLWAKGNDVLLSRTGEDGKQETVKELRGTDYFPVGLEWCYEGNIYKITDVNYQQDTVTLINQTNPSQPPIVQDNNKEFRNVSLMYGMPFDLDEAAELKRAFLSEQRHRTVTQPKKSVMAKLKECSQALSEHSKKTPMKDRKPKTNEREM